MQVPHLPQASDIFSVLSDDKSIPFFDRKIPKTEIYIVILLQPTAFLSALRMHRGKMTGTKRRALTTDDLMRRQEEPNRKRIRIRRMVVDKSEDEDGSDSDEEAARLSDDSETDEARGEERGEARLKDDENNADSKDGVLACILPSDRFNIFRRASKPRIPLEANIYSQTLSTTFLSLGVSPPLQDSLFNMSIRTPTEVQVACIPSLLAGKFSSDGRSGICTNPHARQRLHRECQDWVWENCRICNPHPPDTVC
jgi:hypothetical protein